MKRDQFKEVVTGMSSPLSDSVRLKEELQAGPVDDEARHRLRGIESDLRVLKSTVERSADEVHAEYEALCAQFLAAMREVAEDHPDKLARWICEGVLGIDGSDPSPFRMPPLSESNFRHAVQRSQFEHFRDPAEVYLAALDRSEAKERGDPVSAPAQVEFMSIREWVIAHGYAPEHIPACRLTQGTVDGVVRDFFEFQESTFRISLMFACEVIHHGVPLYERRADAEKPVLLSWDNHDYIYISKKAEYEDVGEDRFPAWTRYLLKPEHVAMERNLFGQIQLDTPSPEVIQILRGDLRRRILGNESSSSRTVDQLVSERASRAALERNKENIQMREQAIQFYIANESRFSSVQQAAEEIAGEIVPVKPRTVAEWISNYRRTRVAETR